MKQPKPTLASLTRDLERLRDQYGVLADLHHAFVRELAVALECDPIPNRILAVLGEYVAAYDAKERRQRIEDEERDARLHKDAAVIDSGIDKRSMGIFGGTLNQVSR